MQLVTRLTRWQIALRSGGVIEVWADGYSTVDGDYVFGVLADAPQEEREDLRISGTTPTSPDRVIVALAIVPTTEVESIRGG